MLKFVKKVKCWKSLLTKLNKCFDIIQVLNAGFISLADLSEILVVIFTLLQIVLIIINLVIKIKNNPENKAESIKQAEEEIQERKEDIKK